MHQLLVPLDGSERAERALDFALSLAQKGVAAGAKSTVMLLRAPTLDLQEIFLPSMVEHDAQWQEADAAELASLYLQRIRQKYDYLGLPIETVVREGDPAGHIVDLAAEAGVDLIVMAPRGVSGLSRWVFGSVTERVLREAPCPVLVAHESPPFEAVIVTLDGSALAEAALPAGLALARVVGCPITLLRVEPAAGDAGGAIAWEEAGGAAEMAGSDPVAAAAAYLDGVARGLDAGETPIRRVLLFGPAADRIIEYVEGKGPRLLAMATHGRTGLSRWVYGSVTEKVMRGTERPLLIVRPRPAK